MFNWEQFVNEQENRNGEDQSDPSFSLHQFRQWLKTQKEGPKPEPKFEGVKDNYKEQVRKRVSESIERKVQERKRKRKR